MEVGSTKVSWHLSVDGYGQTIGSLAERAKELLGEYVPSAMITHYGGGYLMHADLLGATPERLDRLFASDYSFVSLYAGDANDKDPDRFASPGLELEVDSSFSDRTGCVSVWLRTYASLGISKSALFTFFDTLSVELGCHSGYAHHQTDANDQSEPDFNWFKVMRRAPPRNAKIIRNSKTGVEEIDIESNPGHTHFYRQVDFGASWTNYLGPLYLDYLEIDRAEEVASLVEGVAHEVVVLDERLVRVTLFEDPYEYASDESIRRLWEYRRRLRIDEVAHRLIAEQGL